MITKGSKLYSILFGKCPKCQEESMYTHPRTINFFRLLKMNESCSHCHLKFNLEPSFFYGAMYVSYGLSVAVGIITFIVTKVFLELDFFKSFVWICIAVILTVPPILRLSRNIWINMFVNFDKEWKNKLH